MFIDLARRGLLIAYAYISEQYAYELQKYNYKNGLIIKKQLSENNFDVTENQVYSVYQE